MEVEESHSPKSVEKTSVSEEFGFGGEMKEEDHQNEGVENEGSDSDEETESMFFENAEAAKQFLEELERGVAVGSLDHSQMVDDQIVVESDEEEETDEEGEEKELFDSAALVALLKAATGADSDGGNKL